MEKDLVCIDKPISFDKFKEIMDLMFWELVKAVVDINKWIMVINWALHSDEEKELLVLWSKQQDLRGINIYPDDFWNEDFIEFDSMINIRPNHDNRSRWVENEEIQKKIVEIVSLLIKKR